MRDQPLSRFNVLHISVALDELYCSLATGIQKMDKSSPEAAGRAKNGVLVLDQISKANEHLGMLFWDNWILRDKLERKVHELFLANAKIHELKSELEKINAANNF